MASKKKTANPPNKKEDVKRHADKKLLGKLISQGYEETAATFALELTKNKSLDAAIDFLRAGGHKPISKKKIEEDDVEVQKAIAESMKGVKSTTPTTPTAPGKDVKGKGKITAVAAAPVVKVTSSGNDSDDDSFFDDASDDDDDDFGFGSAYDSDPDWGDSSAVIGNNTGSMFEYSVLSSDDILGGQKTEMEYVASVLNVSLASAGALLRTFKWNKDRTVETYLEDPAGTAKKAGVVIQETPTIPKAISRSGSSSAKAAAPPTTMTCGICLDDDITQADSKALACNHRFCNDCWSTYLSKKIKEEGEASHLICPEPKCEVVVDAEFVKELVSKEVYQRYFSLLTRSFVDDNPQVKWCPAPGCDYAIQVNFVKETGVICKCKNKFCFGCGRPDHLPASCKDVKEWEKKSKDDSETANWLQANTSDCPACHSAIEKNGGCNHMTCRKCKHEFCWVCFKDWKSHNNNYSCNKFDEGRNAKQSASRAALDRYLFYFHRFSNHEKSSKFEDQIRVNAEKRMEEMQNSSKNTWIDVQYISKACDTLLRCRHALKYTYTMAYFMEEGAAKSLFELLQQDLESNTERLSFFLEAAPLDQLNRLEVVNCTKLAETRLSNLLKGVEDGLVSQ